MTAVFRGPVTALLLRAGIIAGILAIVAGIFGMHVMTGNHTMHSAAAAPAPAVAVTAGESHTGGHSTLHHDTPDTSATAQAGPEVAYGPLAAVVESCTCSAECTSGQQMSAACVPSAKSGSLTAPDPGLSTLAPADRSGLPGRAGMSSYAYVPGSPSPGELSISRT